MVNTTGKQIINIDGIIVYDPAKVTINSAQTGHFLAYFYASPLGSSTNKHILSNWEENISNPKLSTTDTLWATLNITFKEKGETSLSFDCTQGSEADSNINRASDSLDIIKCDSLVPLILRIEN